MKVLIPLLLIIALSCNCEDLSESYYNCISMAPAPIQQTEVYLDYYNAITKWNCVKPNSYTFTYVDKNQGCFGTEVTLSVEQGVITSSSFFHQFPNFGTFCENSNLLKLSIRDIFFTIEEAVDSTIIIEEPKLDEPLMTADQVFIDYDPIYGYPINIRIDYELGYADEEWEIEIIDFGIKK